MSEITILTAVANEGPYLLEWIAHHRAIGIERIFVYSFYPQDHTDKMLELLAADGIVRHIRLKFGTPSPMVAALKQFWKSPDQKKTDWLLPLNVREFLNIQAGDGTADDLLKGNHSGVDGIVLPYNVFGFNQQIEISNKGVLGTHSLSAGIAKSFPYELSLGKMLMSNKQIFLKPEFYRPKQKPVEKARKPHFIGADNEPIPDFYTLHDHRLSLTGHLQVSNPKDIRAQINFYPLRSLEDYFINGFYQGAQHKYHEPNLDFWIENNFHEVEDLSISKVSARRSRIHDDFFKIKELKGLVDLAREHHRNLVSRLLAEPQMHELFNKLFLLKDSVLPGSALAQKLNTKRQELEDKLFAEEQDRLALIELKKENKRKRAQQKKRAEEKKKEKKNQ